MDTSKVDYYLKRGKTGANWYEEESNRLIELLPEFSGLPIVRIFAVTSMTTSIEANVHLAIKALLQMKRKQPFEGFLPNQKLYLDLVRSGSDVPGRKIMSFIRALEGDKDAVVVDIWICRVFGILRRRQLPNGRDYFRAPTNKEYTQVELFCQQDAYKRGIEPRTYQAMLWSGIKSEEGVISKNISWSELLRKKRGFISYC